MWGCQIKCVYTFCAAVFNLELLHMGSMARSSDESISNEHLEFLLYVICRYDLRNIHDCGVLQLIA